MSRGRSLAVHALLAFSLVLGAIGLRPAEGRFEELDLKTQIKVVRKARAYFDPDAEFLWRPRKELLDSLTLVEEQLGVHPLADLELMKDIVYQGRRFRLPFDDRRWQHANSVDFKKKSVYCSVKSEEWRFTYTTPKRYPPGTALAKTPRRGHPYPLLVTLHEKQDTRTEAGRAEPYPGMAVLERRYPRPRFQSLYDRWLTLAPVAAGARFLENDKSVRHLFLTGVITEFLRHYHVDFDRIVIDGGEAAAALCACFPHIFAGLVLRGGPVEPELVENYASVPVYVVGDPDLAQSLVDAGHPDVASGGADEHLVTWLDERRRVVPASFTWRMTREDHRFANWITLLSGMRQRKMTVATDRAKNRIAIHTEGANDLQIYLNDEIVDLDRRVTVVLNDHERTFQVERSFAQMFDRDPFVRRNMSFYWLYPVRLDELEADGTNLGPSVGETDEPTDTSGETEEIPAGTAEAEDEARRWYERGLEYEKRGEKVKARAFYRKAMGVGSTSFWRKAEARLAVLEDRDPGRQPPPATEPREPEPWLDRLSEPRRLEVQLSWLYGRLDLVKAQLDHVTHPEDELPLYLLDLWWRPTNDAWLEADVAKLAEQSTGVVREQYKWLLGGGAGPYPEAQDPHQDPWSVITALVLDRQYRESVGRADLPERSPLAELHPPDDWAEWWPEWKVWFLENRMRVGFEDENLDLLPDLRREVEDRDALAGKVGLLNRWLAILAGVLFVGGVLVAGRRLKPSSEARTPEDA